MAFKKIEYKTCSRCGWEKPTTEFYKRAAAVDGLQAACKACTDEGVRRAIAKPPKIKTPDGTKQCSHCRELKPLDQFYKNRRRFDGLHHMCKACMAPGQRKWLSDPKNREKVNAARRAADRTVNRSRRADGKTRRKFNLPRNWSYDEMLARQDGKCAICGATQSAGKSCRLHVDHCHETNVIRGLLCMWCNQAIGQMRHSPELLRHAAAYLEKPQP